MTKKESIKQERSIHRFIFIILLIIFFSLGTISLAKASGLLIPSQPEPLIEQNRLSLDSLTLEQKIAQMIIVAGNSRNLIAWKKMQLGGIHLFAQKDEALFRETIQQFQAGMSIPFLVTVDLEGCQNPFGTFKEFTPASEITREGAAFEKGSEEGKFLASLGISVNFAPVVDLDDQIWKCRTFPGDAEQIATFAEAYTLGLQKEGVQATAKHYPGKTLVAQDPHQFIVAAEITPADLYPYQKLSSSVGGIMVSHIISSGAISSNGLPSVTSPQVVHALRENYHGLIISDEINMLGLKNFYKTPEELYLAVFRAGNDLILNFNEDPLEIYQMITVIKNAVENGDLAEEQIDQSVRRILMVKGLTVQ